MLNPDQQKAYDTVLNTPNRIIVIKGAAGCGKSYLATEIIKAYKAQNKSILITATTHKAKRLLAEALHSKAPQTIHKVAGFRMQRLGKEEELQPVNEPWRADVIIVDEISMLPNEILQTIIACDAYKKIILFGDSLQLPPIGKPPQIPANAISIELTINMRQEKNETLKKYFDNIRAAIRTKPVKRISFSQNPPSNVFFYNNFRDFAMAYKDCEYQKRILAYTNKTIDCYNSAINKGKTGTKFQIGDRLIMDKPLQNTDIKNNDEVEVTKVHEENHYFLLNIKCDGDEVNDLRVYKTKGAEELYLDKENSSTEEYWLKNDKVIHPKHIYASTIHKTQGDTIEAVFIDGKDVIAQIYKKPTYYQPNVHTMEIEEYLRLMYVALSRMKEQAHVFIGDKRNYDYFKRG